MKTVINCLILLLVSLLFTTCTKDHSVHAVPDPQGCRDTLFTFDKDILPILNLSCNFDECHHSGAPGSYDFEHYNVVVNRIRAGTFEYRIDLPDDDPQHMPEKMHLNHCDYFTLKKWIQQGYPEN